MSVHLGGFILSNINRFLINIIREIDGLKTNNAYYTDLDSLWIGKKHWDVSDKTQLF